MNYLALDKYRMPFWRQLIIKIKIRPTCKWIVSVLGKLISLATRTGIKFLTFRALRSVFYICFANGAKPKTEFPNKYHLLELLDCLIRSDLLGLVLSSAGVKVHLHSLRLTTRPEFIQPTQHL